jgi:hypothetical protein
MGKHCAARRRGTCSPPAASSYPPAPVLVSIGDGEYGWSGIPWPGLDQFYPAESLTEGGPYVEQEPYDVTSSPGTVAYGQWVKGRFGDGTLFSPYSNTVYVSLT